MDELIDALADSQVTLQSNSTAAEHPHFSLYKRKQSGSSQEERRRKFLELQKKNRYDQANYARSLASGEFNDETNDYTEEEEGMEYEETLKRPRTYKNQLMLSEWLVDLPSDLDTQWLLLLCPVGKRCLVVSSRGRTKVYTKNGYMINSFRSYLPGSSTSASNKANAYSLLDCIYDELNKTFHILDVMCWNSHPCYDSETEFRFYWMHSKIDETPGIKEISKNNPYKFIPLPYYNCDKESLKSTLWSPLPFPAKLDGLLFYHKGTHYNIGTTPLVGWLKAYMVHEFLDIEVPDYLTLDKPSSYVDMKQHIPKAFEISSERKKLEENQMQYEGD